MLPRCSALLLLCLAAGAAAQPPPARLAQGEYLARAADCVACHTAPGGKQYAGGRAFKLSMGTIYAPNITPDRATGIGDWTDEDFIRAMHEGVGPDGKHYYPAFPYNYFTRLSRDDVLAIKSYLFSLPPVQYRAPESELRFPYNQRWLMVFWNWLYNPNERFEPEPEQSAQWNRGAYLVEGLGHCGACHTPMNFLQGPKNNRHLGGETLQGWRAYNITSDKEYGIGGWSDQDLVSYLSTGRAEGHGAASGPMAEAVEYSLRFLSRDDLQSMVAYLRTVKPVRSDTVPAARARVQTVSSESELLVRAAADSSTGARVFASACASCHDWNGAGLQSAYAALSGSRSLIDPEGVNLSRVILEGTRMHTAEGEVFMPGFAQGYTDFELAAVANFTSKWFGLPTVLTASEIRERRDPAHVP